MAYERFDETITQEHCVIVKNWPLEVFCNPSDVPTRTELEILYNAWRTGTTYFQKLTREEMNIWEEARFTSRIESMGKPAEPVPALSSPQTLASEPVPPSEPPQQDALTLTLNRSPTSLQSVPLSPVTNLTPGSVQGTTPRPPVPNPDTIAMMIRADPALQNIDPTLIAMSITENELHRASTVVVGRAPNHVTTSQKRRWQEVITPLSYTHTVKRPKKQRKRSGPQGPHPAI
jgi:hypothetical protein